VPVPVPVLLPLPLPVAVPDPALGVAELRFFRGGDAEKGVSPAQVGMARVVVPLEGDVTTDQEMIRAWAARAMHLKTPEGKEAFAWRYADFNPLVNLRRPFPQPVGRVYHEQGCKQVEVLLKCAQLALAHPVLGVSLSQGFQYMAVALNPQNGPGFDLGAAIVDYTASAAEQEAALAAAAALKADMKTALTGTQFPPKLLFRGTWEAKVSLLGSPAHVQAAKAVHEKGLPIATVVVMFHQSDLSWPHHL